MTSSTLNQENTNGNQQNHGRLFSIRYSQKDIQKIAKNTSNYNKNIFKIELDLPTKAKPN